jgi:hypothetical protein
LADYKAKNPRELHFFDFRNNEPVIRICKEDELPTDLMFHTIFPMVVFFLVISLLSSLCLQTLGDDLEVYRWLNIVSPSLIKDLLKLKLFNQELDSGKTEEEEKEKGKQLKLLEATLVDLIRQADATTLNHQDKQTGKL